MRKSIAKFLLVLLAAPTWGNQWGERGDDMLIDSFRADLRRYSKPAPITLPGHSVNGLKARALAMLRTGNYSDQMFAFAMLKPMLKDHPEVAGAFINHLANPTLTDPIQREIVNSFLIGAMSDPPESPIIRTAEARKEVLKHLDDPHLAGSAAKSVLAPLMKDDPEVKNAVLATLDHPDQFRQLDSVVALQDYVGKDADVARAFAKMVPRNTTAGFTATTKIEPLASTNPEVRQALLDGIENPAVEGYRKRSMRKALVTPPKNQSQHKGDRESSRGRNPTQFEE